MSQQPVSRAPADRLPRLAFVLSIFLSALLLFLMQPIIARVLLTLHGGSPAVWNTCMVCFQGLLMAGYAYAHWSTDALGVRRQVIVHAMLLLISMFVLSYELPALEASHGSPVVSIVMAVLLTAGLPFSLLASNSSLVQRWYSLSEHGDPFALYAVSNFGSLLGLLGFPLLFEPAFGLARGWRVWAGLYVCFLAVSACCMAIAFRSRPTREGRAHPEPGMAEPRTSWRRRMGWAFRAAVAASLLLSVTMKITTDIASAPVFWVVPLSLYLLTFIIAFSSRIPIPRWIIAAFTAIGIAWAMTGCFYTIVIPIRIELAVLLSLVFFGSLLCHVDLAASRPAPRELTRFYLWISVGGAVGGIFNSLLAPLLFDSLIEFPLTLLALAFLIHARGGYLQGFPAARMRRIGTWLPPVTIVLVLGVTAALIALRWRGDPTSGDAASLAAGIQLAVPLGVILFGLLMARHPGQLEFGVLCLTIYASVDLHQINPVIAQQRSFFGVLRIRQTRGEIVFVHGTTTHGAQSLDPAKAGIPSRYFHPSGPLGEALQHQEDDARIGIVGLGAGSLAALGKPGQTITFFEIDRAVERMAREHFTYLRDATATIHVEIGDGRLLLQKAPDRSFDLLVLDAFSSDAIPTHLLTREALNLYLRKVTSDGLVVAHVSNRHLDLTSVVRAWAEAERRAVLFIAYQPTAADSAAGASSAHAVAIAPEDATLATLVEGGKWRWLPAGKRVAWTDDRVDLLATLRKRR